MSYSPTPVPPSPEAIPNYLSIELQALSQSLQQAQPFAFLQTLHVAPKKPRAGMIVKADGTDWNPGSGAGPYIYSGSAWVAMFGGGGGGGTVTSVTGTSPVQVATGTTTPVVSLIGLSGLGAALLPIRVNSAGTALEYGGTSKYVRGASWSGQGFTLGVPADDVAITCVATGTITSATLIGIGGVGSAVVDVWRTGFTGTLPNVSNTITASALPTIAGGIETRDTTLTGWTTAVTAGDVFVFHLVSVSVFRALHLILEIK